MSTGSSTQSSFTDTCGGCGGGGSGMGRRVLGDDEDERMGGGEAEDKDFQVERLISSSHDLSNREPDGGDGGGGRRGKGGLLHHSRLPSPPPSVEGGHVTRQGCKFLSQREGGGVPGLRSEKDAAATLAGRGEGEGAGGGYQRGVNGVMKAHRDATAMRAGTCVSTQVQSRPCVDAKCRFHGAAPPSASLPVW